MVIRNSQYRRGRSHERSPLRPDRFSTSYSGCGPTPRPPGLQTPTYGTDPTYHRSGYQANHDRKYRRDSSPLRPATFTAGWICVPLVFLVVLAQIVSFVLFYNLPTKIGVYNRAIARMREQQDAMKREERYLESERIAFREESDHLEKQRLALESAAFEMEGERLALKSATLEMERERDALESAIRRAEQERSRLEREKQLLEDERHSLEHEKEELRKEREKWERAREDRVPQGAFWAVGPWPAQECLAYGKREYWGELRNIPEDWDDLDACMNMPATIKDVPIRRPDRCGYVADSPHIHGFWMVDWGQVDCQSWHQDITDKVSLGQLTWLHLHVRLGSRTLVSRVARTRDLAPVVSRPGLWVLTIAQNKTGACCARARLSHGTTSRITAPHTVKEA